MSLFNLLSKSQQADTIATQLPNDRLFEAKSIKDTKLRKLLLGLGVELMRAEGKMNEIIEQYSLLTGEQLIEEWEKTVGIPDDCFDIASTIEQRRNNVLIKLAKMSASTEEGFINLALLFGFNITITTGYKAGIFPLCFPHNFFGTAKEARFTMFVDITTDEPSVFPLPFPINFSSGIDNIMECVLNKIKPANVRIIFRYI